MRRLLEAGIDITDITHILLSHFHPDHCGELVSFLFANKYPDSDRRTLPLVIAGGIGLNRFFKHLQNAFGEWILLHKDLLTVSELDSPDIRLTEFQDFSIHWTNARHNPESLAYRLTAPSSKSLVYSGDTDYSDAVIELARKTEVFVCECSMPDQQKFSGHLSPSVAGSMAAKAETSLLVLTHFYPECDRIDIERQCRKTYHGPLILAKDLLTIMI
jgi:ribonuclease BN (tRNA processing enzyme)